MSIYVDIADAVVAQLNSGTFNPPFVAQRRLLPDFDLADLAELKVTVVPRSVEISTFSRSLQNHDIQIDIGVQKKLDGDIDGQLPDLMDLVDQIGEFLCKRPLSAAPQACWLGVKNELIYSPQHLLEKRVFTSVLTVTYRIVR